MFAGNPGTGKTTVARLVGEMYAASGVLERGQLVEMGPDSFLGRWQGGNTERIGRAVKAALGGVLLIDEAYSLNSRAGAPMEFAQQVIDSLVKALEDHRDNLVVIFTGYPEEMEGFLDTNPGLRSRIGPVIRFPDYTPEELVLVLLRMAAAAEVLLDEGVTEAFRAHVAGLPGHRAKGNARYVRNVFEDAIGNLAIRLADEDLTQLPDSDLSTLLIEDLRHALARIPDAAPRKGRIGFTTS